MKKNTFSSIGRLTAFALALTLSIFFLSGCVNHTEDIYSAADGLLSSAKDGKMDKLTSYASDDVLVSLGWDDETVSGYKDQILSAVSANSDIDKEEFLENEDVSNALDELIDTINASRISEYSIDKDSIYEKNNQGYVTAKVTIQTKDAIKATISDEDIKSEVEQKVYDYMTANMDSLAEYIDSGDTATLYSTIMVAILPDVLDLLKEKLGEVKGEEQTWKLTCSQEKDKWIVSEVKADE